ncbi:ferredoxin family protein [Telmatocola sphagniphila]|uniref:Ferredoxin family protein n=1 Tax=Telmatocola sphagniphila TaxID=1123043 RepID=A0A8E6B4U6_9BACT|nr:ferredoxin family protein [Telmatocola sphagniphila]QVL32160.1 ferredoxin family protein [Telmatocola sphagniphila]
MSRYKLNVILSQAPGKHPAKRSLEESIAAALIMEPGLEVSIIPNLYDLSPDHTGRLFLGNVAGDMVVLSWLYSRAAFWLLDRIGIKGNLGEIQLKAAEDREDEEDTPTDSPEENKAIGVQGPVPDRHIYCLDLRDSNLPEAYVQEIRRIYQECKTRREQKTTTEFKPSFVQLGLLTPVKNEPAEAPTNANPFSKEQLLAPPGRRWYPVIDYSRCTNCLECLDFCLFGVYDVDKADTILVANQDNCKKGCPACSRVCPQQAIIFPEYKSPAIAGADVGSVSGLKIDLTRLFGGEVSDPLSQAVAERDRELVADGRNAVGTAVGIPKRQENRTNQPADDLDKLMDDLDALGL